MRVRGRQLTTLTKYFFPQRSFPVFPLRQAVFLQDWNHLFHPFIPPAQRCHRHDIKTINAGIRKCLQVVGRVRGAAYASGAIVLHSAESIQRASEVRFSGDEEQQAQVNAIAELDVCQSLNVVTDLILNATTLIFDALGASATLRTVALDRFWRNARTLSSHHPRIYKDRIVGDFAVNGTLPPGQWRIGIADPT